MSSDSSPTLGESPLPGPIGMPVALLEELRPIARRLGLRAGLTGPSTGTFAGREIVALVCGIGQRRAGRVAAELVDRHGCRSLLSVGFGGGLDPGLKLADARAIAAVIAPDEGRYDAAPSALARLDGPPAVCLSVRQALATPAAKAAAWAESGAHMVDMETAAVAQVAAERGVPWIGVRAVSDAAETALPQFVARHLDPASGQLHLFRMFGYLILRPGTWPELVRLASQTRCAAAALADATAGLLERTA